MSKLDGKKLNYAVLHAPLHHPDIGQWKTTLRTKGDAQNPAVISMTICEPWVLVEFPNAKDRKKSVQVPVPINSFSHTVLE